MHLLDINGPAHLFYEAKEYGADVNLHFVTIDNQKEIQSSAGLYFTKLSSFSQFTLTKNDFIFIPGIEFQLLSDPVFIQKSKLFFDWLKVQYANEVNICSVCTGTFLLAESGILDGHKCTTHWKYLTEFKSKFKSVELINNRLCYGFLW